MSTQPQTGRKDHYVPRGYLKGFIDPARAHLAKPLWKLDLETRIWSRESPGSVGYERGFYDYMDTPPNQHPDNSFKDFEDEFPSVLEHMIKRRFKGWVKQHKAFLLGYMQMMRARSPLFIQQQTAQNRNVRGATVTAVEGNKITVDSLELRPMPEHFVRNRTITQIIEEIKKGPDWMWDFNWCLRYTNSISDAFITGSHPLVLEGPAPTLDEAMKDDGTFLWFPLCWQACLIGNRQRFNEGTDAAHPTIINHVREVYLRPMNKYMISPTQIDIEQIDYTKECLPVSTPDKSACRKCFRLGSQLPL